MQVQQDKINHNVLGLGFDIRLPVNSECLIKGKLQRKIKPNLNQIPGLGQSYIHQVLQTLPLYCGIVV